MSGDAPYCCGPYEVVPLSGPAQFANVTKMRIRLPECECQNCQ
jgi:hypothetical protein